MIEEDSLVGGENQSNEDFFIYSQRFPEISKKTISFKLFSYLRYRPSYFDKQVN